MSIKAEVNRFIRFIDNQSVYMNRVECSLGGKDLEYIHEIVFLREFREYEALIEGIFLNAMYRNETINGTRLNSYIKARNSNHALELLKLEKQYVDWDSPSTIITRAEIIFGNPHPLTMYFAAKQEKLQEAKKVRNYIAHKSAKSESEFNRVYQNYFGAVPVSRIEAGEFLENNVPRVTPLITFTKYYGDIMKEISSII